MVFLLSLVIALCFVQLCGEALRKHPAPFYIAAAVLSAGAVCVTNFRLSGIPAWVSTYLLGQLTKGTLATAFWAVVMWTGALPNGSALMKKWMPVRGQLSIFAAILTLGHALGCAISYFPRWIAKADALNLTVCIVLMLIMIPLTVISVQKIRRKFKAKSWKRMQRFAYLFYALIPFHVILLNFQRARAGRSEALFSLIVYLAVFLGYAVCRLRKWILRAKKPEKTAGLNFGAAAAFVLLFGAMMLAVRPQQAPETVQTIDTKAAVQEEEEPETGTQPADETAAESTSTTAKPESAGTGTTVTSDTESGETTTETTETEPADENDEEESEAEEDAPEENNDAPEDEPEPDPEPQGPFVFQNGTFSAVAYGYDGDITVYVTFQEDMITEITAETAELDDSYFFDAKRFVIPAILSSQSPDVDALSGATYSSNGIMEAVRRAMESARI